MSDLLRDVIDAGVPPEWQSGHRPVYRLYDQLAPHCAEAVAYRQVPFPVRVLRYRCRHDIVRGADSATVQGE